MAFPRGVVFIWITLQLCFALVAPLVAFKNSLTTLPGGLVFNWITLQLCFALVVPQWRFRVLCAYPPVVWHVFRCC